MNCLEEHWTIFYEENGKERVEGKPHELYEANLYNHINELADEVCEREVVDG